MRKTIKLFLLFMSIFSTIVAKDFQKNTQLVDTFKCNNLRIVVLCSFQGTNNVLDIVTSSPSPGYALTHYGIAMLIDSLSVLAPLNITHIYSSPTFRTQQSTSLIGNGLGLDPSQLSIDVRLAIQNFGSAEGEDYDLYKARFTSEQDMFENTPENGESGLSVFNRTESFLSSLDSLQNQTILIVTHGFNFCHISKCLTGKYKNVPPTGTFVIYDFKN